MTATPLSGSNSAPTRGLGTGAVRLPGLRCEEYQCLQLNAVKPESRQEIDGRQVFHCKLPEDHECREWKSLKVSTFANRSGIVCFRFGLSTFPGEMAMRGMKMRSVLQKAQELERRSHKFLVSCSDWRLESRVQSERVCPAFNPPVLQWKEFFKKASPTAWIVSKVFIIVCISVVIFVGLHR